MQFTVQREAFLRPLRAVAGVVERKQSQLSPILLNVLIRLQNDQFFLTTTDQEVELVAKGSLGGTVDKEWTITAPVRKLMDICKALPEGESLSLIEEQDRITIRAGRSRFTLSTLPAHEFPCLNEDIGKFKFSMSERDLKSLIEQTCFAMAEQDVRYYLNGMLLEVKNGYACAVAADGHRLAFGKVALSPQENSVARAIIPRKGILELQRVLNESDERVEITLGDNHIRAVTSQVQLTSKLLDGRFPDYERIVLKEGDKVLTGRRERLKEAFQRAAALFTDRFRGVRLRLTEGCLKILATNAEQDEVEEDIEIDYAGDELEIGFNVKYLIDFLNVIQTENVKLIFSDSNSSARIEGIGAENSVYVIMPMRI